MPDTKELNEALAANFMLVDLQLRSWSGKRTDRDASDDLIASKNAARDSGAFVKNLLASAGGELKMVHTEFNAMRAFVYNHTLPWSSSESGKLRGERVIATVRTMDFLRDLAALKKRADTAVLALADVWPQRVAQAMANLGGLADAGDYPTQAQLPSMFAVRVDLKPIPAMSDFSRLNVPAELATALAEQHEQVAQVQVQNAMGDLRERIIAELERIHKQMAKVVAGDKTRLHDSLISNMQVLVEMAKHMNIVRNPKMDELIMRIEASVIQHPVEVYKDNKVAAAKLSADVQSIAVDAALAEVWT